MTAFAPDDLPDLSPTVVVVGARMPTSDHHVQMLVQAGWAQSAEGEVAPQTIDARLAIALAVTAMAAAWAWVIAFIASR